MLSNLTCLLFGVENALAAFMGVVERGKRSGLFFSPLPLAAMVYELKMMSLMCLVLSFGLLKCRICGPPFVVYGY